jgi:serine/threonine protein kinase
MGSGAYGVVMSVRVPVPPILHRLPLLFSFLFGFVGSYFKVSDIVSSAADEISGETVAIKMVTRIFAKTTLAKRALREITLLRHFSNHENITGLIDVDGIAECFNEM